MVCKCLLLNLATLWARSWGWIWLTQEIISHLLLVNGTHWTLQKGCSGIRSLMALVMISAIYAYFTQKKLWKMAVLFTCALPLALVANFLRIFTIIVIAEMGYAEFAAGAYHDWAGLLFFFPIALVGLFLVDKLLNRRENRKVVRTRTQ